MYGVKQSDGVIVQMRAANKEAQASAELTEGRTVFFRVVVAYYNMTRPDLHLL